MNRYRQARVAAGMTQEHLAGASEVSVSTIRRIEKGLSTSAESRRAVASVLGIDVREEIADESSGTSGPMRWGIVLIRRRAYRLVGAGYLGVLVSAFVAFLAMLSQPDEARRALAIWHGIGAGYVTISVLVLGRAAIRVPFNPFVVFLWTVAGINLHLMVAAAVPFDATRIAILSIDATSAWLLWRATCGNRFTVSQDSRRLGGKAPPFQVLTSRL